MAKEIKSEKLEIRKIFENWYRIPNYQRPYVWEKDQITDLLDDISYAAYKNGEAEYFLGSIVLQKKIDNDYTEYDVLDGQQRLTTLFLLTATIRDLTQNKNLKDTCTKIIFQNANEFQCTPERLRVIFDIRNEVKDFIDNYIKNDGGTQKTDDLEIIYNKTTDLSIKNMINAIFEIQKFFKNSNISIEDFFKFLNNKVILIYVASESLEDAFKMFTILNNRGIKLRNSDILKAENLRAIENEQNKYAKDWEYIENYFQESFDVFLSHIRTILVKEKARLNLYDEYEKNIYKNNLITKGKETVEFLKKYQNHYDDIFNKTHEKGNDYRLDNLLSIMKNVLPADFWIPPLLRYYDKYKENRLLDFLEKLDNKFSYDWIISLTPTERINNINKLIKLIDDTDDTNPEIILESDILKINSELLTKELSNDIYGKRFARYVLYKLDYLYGNTDKINVPATITVEHIMPQNPKDDSIWKKDFTDEERANWENKIGNLILISRRKNSAQGNKDYQDKQKKYFKNNIELFRNSLRVFSQFSTWNIDDIEKNHKIVIEKLISHYTKY